MDSCEIRLSGTGVRGARGVAAYLWCSENCLEQLWREGGAEVRKELSARPCCFALTVATFGHLPTSFAQYYPTLGPFYMK